eukprot:gene19783-biopygen4038
MQRRRRCQEQKDMRSPRCPNCSRCQTCSQRQHVYNGSARSVCVLSVLAPKRTGGRIHAAPVLMAITVHCGPRARRKLSQQEDVPRQHRRSTLSLMTMY